MNELLHKIALVVGAGVPGDEGMGNGRATAVTFAREGATVICADANLLSAQKTARMIADEGYVADAVHMDVTDVASVREVVDSVVSKYGRLDVLNNNVGIGAGGDVTNIDPEDWDRVMRVNLTGAFNTMRHVIPQMVRAGGGSVVNISSLASIRWLGFGGAVYYASKAALNHLSSTTAADFAADQVRVNAILPGLIKTPMVAEIASNSGDLEAVWEARDRKVPMGRMGQPWDVANAASFLASDRAKYITGVQLCVDGGMALMAGVPGQ